MVTWTRHGRCLVVVVDGCRCHLIVALAIGICHRHVEMSGSDQVSSGGSRWVMGLTGEVMKVVVVVVV